MTIDGDKVYALLPAIHRMRDAERGEPLRQLIAVLAEQAAVIEEDLEQLYDNHFIETAAQWAVPYIGTLIGYRELHGVVPQASNPRAEVANTIGYRRRKGTASMLEQLAHDVTGWPARVVEFFELLAATQYMNHIRPKRPATADLRRWQALEQHGSGFDSLPHTVDVRSIGRAGGRYGIANVGIFLWRLEPFELRSAPAVEASAPPMGPRQLFRFHPLGIDCPLVTRPIAQAQITHLAEPINVPAPISRRVLKTYLGRYYGAEASLALYRGDTLIPASEICVCDLSDTATRPWAHAPPPAGKVAVDPVLGRIAFASPQTEPVRVTFHYGFSRPMGGGTYRRDAGRRVADVVVGDGETIGDALARLPEAGGIVEIRNSGHYTEPLTIAISEGASIEIRAGDEFRPHLELRGDMTVSGGRDSGLAIDGLLISGGGIVVPQAADNLLESLTIRHSTLVPGRRLSEDGEPIEPDAESVRIARSGVVLRVEDSIIGAVRLANESTAHISNSIVDATHPSKVACAGTGADGAYTADGSLTLLATTVIGKVRVHQMPLVSNSILLARRTGPDDPWREPVRVTRRQEGCVRFSYVPLRAVTPRRFRCQPQLAIEAEIARRERDGVHLRAAMKARIANGLGRSLVPSFTAHRYGRPAYCQLLRSTPLEIRAGADDEAEMGAFHDLYQPQRETNLVVRLDEYLRLGLEAGEFFET